MDQTSVGAYVTLETLVENNPEKPKDRIRIDLNDAEAIRWWCKVLGVTEQELRSAVHDAGTTAHDVRSHLRK